MNIDTKYFGSIEIDDKEIINFPLGVPGFTSEKRFVLLPLEDNPLFQVLQSTSNTDPAFIVVNPYHFLREYAFDIDDSTIELLEIESEKDVSVLSIVSLKNPFEESTINLQAPVVINPTKNVAKQYVTNSKVYTTREGIFSNQPSFQVKGD